MMYLKSSKNHKNTKKKDGSQGLAEAREKTSD